MSMYLCLAEYTYVYLMYRRGANSCQYKQVEWLSLGKQAEITNNTGVKKTGTWKSCKFQNKVERALKLNTVDRERSKHAPSFQKETQE